MTAIERKDTNPKDALGTAKVPFSTIPAQVMAETGLAMMEGALKYGRHNYRVSGVRTSVYYDAALRHLTAFWEGQDIDPDSGLPHLVKAIACCAVVRDSQIRGNWVDDRPPKTEDGWVAELNDKARALLEKHPNPLPAYTEAENVTHCASRTVGLSPLAGTGAAAVHALVTGRPQGEDANCGGKCGAVPPVNVPERIGYAIGGIRGRRDTDITVKNVDECTTALDRAATARDTDAKDTVANAHNTNLRPEQETAGAHGAGQVKQDGPRTLQTVGPEHKDSDWQDSRGRRWHWVEDEHGAGYGLPTSYGHTEERPTRLTLSSPYTEVPRPPRVVQQLTDSERDAEWTDADDDRWRWNHEMGNPRQRRLGNRP